MASWPERIDSASSGSRSRKPVGVSIGVKGLL
jgi:hypothetical protein